MADTTKKSTPEDALEAVHAAGVLIVLVARRCHDDALLAALARRPDMLAEVRQAAAERVGTEFGRRLRCALDRLDRSGSM